MLIKQFFKSSPVEDGDDSGKVSFIASTDRADRYGDIVNQSGWNLENYKSNPIVLLNHDHQSLPIGRGAVSISEKGLVIDVEFDSADPRAAEIQGKVSRGFMNAVSVGFAPIKTIARADLPESHFAFSKSAGSYFEEAELLEVSIVTIPANADAVAAKSFGFDLKQYIHERVLTELKEAPVTTLTKHILAVTEDDESVTVIFAKMKPDEAAEEEEEAAEMEEEGYQDSEKEEDDEENKAFVKALLTLEGDY